MQLDKQYLPYEDQEECCNRHDICYDTCHAHDKLNQTLCDEQFKDCLHTICANKMWWLTYFKCPLSYWFNADYWNENCEESIRHGQDQGNITTHYHLFISIFLTNGKKSIFLKYFIQRVMQ